ncbi:ATPase [Subtercola boreus]|uniref:ATPase n=1 Tax=Subtercola boreus TaxID=120213 RepID=A0A3E0VYF5_9MICO|nr:ATPase [Subtercola boreus]
MSSDQQPWGRVDETGTVYLREPDGERVVGQFPDGSPEEALAYFERKYTDLAGQVTLLEQRVKRGASASDVSKAVSSLSKAIETANAIGDLASLKRRVDALTEVVSSLTEKQNEESKAQLTYAIAERTAIVEEVEALAAEDPAKAQWKQVTARLDDMFARWQKHQQDGPRLPRTEAGELWKRFRDARTIVEGHRKAFFAELDSTHRDARAKKQQLVERAEALIPQGADGVNAYRDLLTEWKNAGRAGKRVDDTLWEKFKAAGDLIYAARTEIVAKDDEEFAGNLTLKLELLTEAEPLLTETDRAVARERLTSIQRRWDEIGKVPRDSVKAVDERLRKVEAAVRKLDDDFWQKNNPEKKARAEGLAGQLTDAIAKLQGEIDAAKAVGNASKVAELQEALDARKVWLDALG